MQNSSYPAMKLISQMHVLTYTRLLYRENNRYLMPQFFELKSFIMNRYGIAWGPR